MRKFFQNLLSAVMLANKGFHRIAHLRFNNTSKISLVRPNSPLSLPSAFEKRQTVLKNSQQKISKLFLDFAKKNLVGIYYLPTFALPIKKGAFSKEKEIKKE